MGFGPRVEEQNAKIGTATNHPIDFITFGRLRARVRFEDAIWEYFPVTADPSAPTGTSTFLFSRVSGGKGQLCVMFPSGAIQILATEP